MPSQCPKCGEYNLQRSHSKTWIEKAVKIALPVRVYRCHSCQWRGWLSSHRIHGGESIGKSFLFYLIVIVISFLVACYLWTRLQ